MINIIRTGNIVFRTNNKTLYKQAVTPQCLLCSDSKSSSDKSEKDGNNDGNKKNKTKFQKPVDIKKTKQMMLKKSRLVEGEKAMRKFVQSSKPSDTLALLKDKTGHGKSQNLVDQTLHADEATESSDIFKKPRKEPIKVPLASKPVSQKKSHADVLTIIKEAAVNLGGEPKDTERDLLKAYMSVKNMPFGVTFGKKGNDRKIKSPEGGSEIGMDLLDKSTPKVLSGNKKLGIFTKRVDDEKAAEQPELKMWKKLYAENLDYLGRNPPRNYFEQLIHWTQEGKLWHFPIDNEQGMELENNTSFTEHIFLEKHLDPWCPKTGPMRHFMELVTVGLSKNPYLSVEQKKEHIMWYRDYFENKRKLLEEIGVIETESTSRIASS